jgi:hypothetical protein
VAGDGFTARRSREQPGLWILAGTIDENADLSFLAGLGAPTRLSMKNICRINSYGVRAWMEAMRHVPPGATLELIECPSPVVDQANMVAGFLGRARIVSFYAPLVCGDCGAEREELFVTEEYRRDGRLPEVSCPRCAVPMQVDDLFARDG